MDHHHRVHVLVPIFHETEAERVIHERHVMRNIMTTTPMTGQERPPIHMSVGNPRCYIRCRCVSVWVSHASLLPRVVPEPRLRRE